MFPGKSRKIKIVTTHLNKHRKPSGDPLQTDHVTLNENPYIQAFWSPKENDWVSYSGVLYDLNYVDDEKRIVNLNTGDSDLIVPMVEAKWYPKKEQSKEIFMDFWEEPLDSERRKHPGIYTSYLFGDNGQSVQIILLDTRTFRTSLLPANSKMFVNEIVLTIRM